MSTKLPLPVRRVLREPMSEETIERLIAAAEPRRPRRTAVPMATGVLALAAAVVLLLVWPREPAAGPVRDAAGAVLAERIEATVPTSVSLDDGSVITLADGAALSVLENDAHDVSLLLERGAVTFDVRPHGPRRWTIECALATVTVVGTRFTIARDAHRVAVSVERGVVLVRGERVPDHARRLTGGEQIEIRDAVPAVRAESPVAPSPSPESTTPAPPAATDVALAPTARAMSWRALARETRWDDAYVALGPSGVSGASDDADVDDLLVLADVARLSGHPADAVLPLERIVASHADDARASLAALSLGRIEDRLGHSDRAAAAFGRALALGLPLELRGVALSRRASSLEHAGEHASAVEVARECLEAEPDCADLPAMRAILERH